MKKQLSQKRSRIAMISTHGFVAADPPLGAADTGGQVVYVLELSKKLAQLGFKVDILTRKFEKQPATEIVAPNVRLIRFPCGGKEFITKEYLYEHIPEWCVNALRWIKKEKLFYKFINSHYWDAGLAGRTLANQLNIPHLHTPHSIGTWKKKQMEQDNPEEKEQFESRYNFSNRIRHENLIYRDCDLVIATSPDQWNIIQKDYCIPAEKVDIVPPGYDDNRFYPVSEASRSAIREQLGFEKLTVLAIGRLARNKGYDLLIRSFAVTAKLLPEARLKLAVGGSDLSSTEQDYLKSLQQLVKDLDLENYVDWSAYIEDEDLADWYRAADVFALSSRYEPFGMTTIEAMACGTAAVITTNGGLWRSMTFGAHALYADSFNAQEYGIALYQSLKYPRLRNRLGQMGGQKVRSMFTWTGIAQQIISKIEVRSIPNFITEESTWSFDW